MGVSIDEIGGASAVGADGEFIAYASAPWAVDAAGTPVPTHFEVDGTTLYQVVEHRSGHYEYGIVADPWWNPFSWNWGGWFSSAAKALGNSAKWLVGKTWFKTLASGAVKLGYVGIGLCLVKGTWAWYRSDARGLVRAGDALVGCIG